MIKIIFFIVLILICVIVFMERKKMVDKENLLGAQVANKILLHEHVYQIENNKVPPYRITEKEHTQLVNFLMNTNSVWKPSNGIRLQEFRCIPLEFVKEYIGE